MYVMATNTRGTSMRPQYSANIYSSPDYGYYEMFICLDWKIETDKTTGCLHEIATEKSFRFANVATPNFAWFIDNFNEHERSLVNRKKFELCILDGTEYMRKSFLKKSNANLGQRIKMPRNCFIVKLQQQEKNGKIGQCELKNRRHKRDVEDHNIWEKLYKIEPKKQALLFKMASNDLLPIGSIDIDDYLNEIAAITNVNAAQLLEYDEKEFENFGKKFGKVIFHGIAQNRMTKIIKDAENIENVFGIGSLPTIKLVIEDIKKIVKTIKNIYETEKARELPGLQIQKALELLGLQNENNLNENIIKRAYYKAALKNHPDKNGGTPEANEKFQQIRNAYEKLLEEAKPIIV